MWELNIKIEAECFFLSLLLGVFICLIYDFFKAMRQKFEGMSITMLILTDILFFLFIILPVYTHFLIFTNGQIRFYVLFTVFVGFLISRFTLSRLNLIVFGLLFAVLKCIFSKISCLFVNAGKAFVKIFENIRSKRKKLLKTG